MKISFGHENYNGFINFGLNISLFKIEIDDGECMEIYAPKILDYVPHDVFPDFITSLIKKLRKGGKITLGGLDIMETAKQILRGDYDIIAANATIYGNKDKPKLGQYSLYLLTQVFQHHGLKIEQKILDSNEMCIKAIRE